MLQHGPFGALRIFVFERLQKRYMLFVILFESPGISRLVPLRLFQSDRLMPSMSQQRT
jgi:hypothetical protein